MSTLAMGVLIGGTRGVATADVAGAGDDAIGSPPLATTIAICSAGSGDSSRGSDGGAMGAAQLGVATMAAREVSGRDLAATVALLSGANQGKW